MNDLKDRRGNPEEGRRFEVHWSLTAGHRTLGAVRGIVVNVGISGVMIKVPAEYDIGNVIEMEGGEIVLALNYWE